VIDKDVEQFSVSSQIVAGSPTLRLDAGFYNREAVSAVNALESSSMDVRPLGDLVERVFIPPRFKRIYVDREHGVPFLQGSHIVQLHPTDLKYLSRTAQKGLERWIIRAGWILVTCSGTVGRVVLAPRQWDEWAASQHILRIIPQDRADCPPGYLAAFLASPLGQAQLTAQVYGAVVDELTEDQARSVRVPVAKTAGQRAKVQKIHQLTLRASEQRADAVASDLEAALGLSDVLPQEATQRTPKGKDIPIPSREAFVGDLRKIAEGGVPKLKG
jgi:type I restriction enzyme S subunit